jgi:hypothetical protein
LDDGILGPFTIQATQNSVTRTVNFNLMVSPVMAGTITTRMLTETSGSNPVPVGSPFRFGVAFKRSDVSAGASFTAVDGGGNIVSAQADAFNYWPDGSVRWCEVRGYTARAINPGGTDTLSFVRNASLFHNTLPNGKTPGQLLTDLQSFGGARDLIIECDAMASCSGASNVYTTGNWLAHFNTLLAGPYVQQVNKGPCCMGFRAWGQLTNGSINHAHIHIAVYVWLWLNPSTGAIRDVEYLVYLHNSLLSQSTDGTPYSSFPPDRYNYNPVLKNGSTVIVNNSDPTMLLHSGSPGNVGGHHARSGWYTARADGKPRWIAGTVEAQNLSVTVDPIQSNPQIVHAARDYLLATGLVPKYDIANVSPSAPQTGQISYSPMVKGLWAGEDLLSDWTTNIAIDSGGDASRIGIIPDWNVRDLFLQTAATGANHRISALGFMTYPGVWLDVNGRVPNIRNTDYTGLTPHNTSLSQQLGVAAWSEGTGGAFALGNWNYSGGTSHWPNAGYYTYLMEGGAHHRDIVAMGAGYVEMTLCNNWAVPGNFSSVNRQPTLGGKTFYGNTLSSGQAPRDEAWAFRELVWASAILPNALADGTVYGELQFFKNCMADSVGYAVQVLATFVPEQLNNGFWSFYGPSTFQTNLMIGRSGSDDAWMQAYLGQALGRAKILHGGEAFGADITTICNHHRKYFEGILGGSFCSILSAAQTINVRNGIGTTTTWKSNWAQVGKFSVNNFGLSGSGGEALRAAFLDTATGWITITGRGSPYTTKSWPECPFDVGATIAFTQDYFAGAADPAAPPAAPSPFVMDTQTYYIIAIDLANYRVQVSTTPGGPPVIPTATQIGVYWYHLDLASCPASYHPVDNPSLTLTHINYNGQSSHLAECLTALRTYRFANDTPASQAADANSAPRVAANDWSQSPYKWILP